MRAVYLTEHVQPSDLRIVERETPSPKSGEVLVAVRAAGVNPSDVKYAAGISPTDVLPRIPGRDFAGVVEQGPDELLGREVYGSGGDIGITGDGTHAQYICLPASGVSAKPAKLSMSQAAAVGVPYVTAWKCVNEAARLKEGETILIIGGSGAVGTAAAQIAKWVGAQVITTSRDRDTSGEWRTYSDSVITLPDESIAESVMKLTEGNGANVVLNAVGGETFEPGVESLAAEGRMACISASGERRVSFDLMRFYKRQMSWFGVDTMEYSASDCAPILDQLRLGFESGAFKVIVAKEVTLEDAATAYHMVIRGGEGKVVLTMP